MPLNNNSQLQTRKPIPFHGHKEGSRWSFYPGNAESSALQMWLCHKVETRASQKMVLSASLCVEKGAG